MHTFNVFIYILKGSIVTFKLYGITAIFSVAISILFAWGKTSNNKTLKYFLEFYTWVFRGTPLLLQLFFTYYGLPVIGIKLSGFNSAVITFILNYTAYLTEIFRAGIESIDKGQFEAAKALGLNYKVTMIRIILPQTFKRVLPPLCNEAINLVKDTAMITVIGMAEILRNAKEVVTREFTIMPFILAAVVYLLITSAIVIIFKNIEKRYSVYE